MGAACTTSCPASGDPMSPEKHILLSPTHYTAAPPPPMPPKGDPVLIARIRKMFDDCDADGSGDLSMVEVKAAFQHDNSMAAEYGMFPLAVASDDASIRKIFAEVDKDGSMRISWEEFLTYVLAHLKDMPENITRHVGQHKGKNPNSLGDQPDSLANGWDLSAAPTGQTICSWELDYWSLNSHQEIGLVIQALSEWDCFAQVGLPKHVVAKFVDMVRQSYRQVPYHNFKHALATMHYTFKLIQAVGVRDMFEREELFAIIIAAVCHDCDHRGRNTAFEIASLSELALRYGDDSPLERHHCAKTFEIALGKGADDQCNVFAGLSTEAFHNVRKLIIACILGTDMAHHGQHMQQLAAMDTLKTVDKKSVAELFLHTADIGNPLMPVEISQKWGKAVAEEFTAQVAGERSLGIPVTAMMDGLTDPAAHAKSQIGFIDFVVAPLNKILWTLCPSVLEPKENLEKNRSAQMKIMEQLASGAAAVRKV